MIVTIHPGWNIWAVYQLRDLSSLNPLWWGVPRDRRLQIWVEDAVRIGAPAAEVADPTALKGSQVQILTQQPADLQIEASRADAGALEVLTGGADLRFVRFFNRASSPAQMPWPLTDGDQMLEAVYTPKSGSAATSGAPPTTILDGAGQSITAASSFAVKAVLLAGGLYLGIRLLTQGKK